MTLDEAREILGKTISTLGEHFDHVQILTSWADQTDTQTLYKGCGNWYARQGMAHDFINRDIAQENAIQIADKITPAPPPDDGDEWKAPV